ncbi:MAG: hypothetical protein ACPGSD_15365 [Flavobacteriales bacterium]
MKNYFILVGMLLLSIPALSQSKISVFQLIKKTIENVWIDSLENHVDTLGTLGDVFGDSIEVSAICMVSDTTDTYYVHVQAGNLSGESFNIYSDSLNFINLPINDSLDIYRKGRVLYMDFGIFAKTDTLYGESWLNRNDGTPSEILYYPLY